MIQVIDGTQRPQADEVLSRIKSLAAGTSPNNLKGWLQVSIYENCRERGYHVSNSYLAEWDRGGMRAVSFSENRNSDDIVVYFGTTDTFDDNTHIPDEETYKCHRHFFSYRDFDGAAKSILSYLIEGLIPHQV